MIKIALATDSLIELNDVKKLLTKHYDIEKETEEKAGASFVTVLTIRNTPFTEIKEMFELLEAATGVDPRKRKSGKRHVVRVLRAAAYLLHYRFRQTHPKVAEILNYTSHTSSVIHCKQFLETINVNRRSVPIQLAIRRVLEVKIPDRRGRKPHGCIKKNETVSLFRD